MALLKRCSAVDRGHVVLPFLRSQKKQFNVSSKQDSTIDGYDATQIELMLHDECILVDDTDNIIGHASKKQCHLTSNSYLHRAFSVLLFDSDNRLLMQQRAKHKITFPNYWTNTCCSHPLFIDKHCELLAGDESVSLQTKIDGVKHAAINRLNKELGIPLHEIQDINLFSFMTRILYKAVCDDTRWSEHELDYILILRKNVTLNLNENEVSHTKYCTQQQLAQMVHDTELCISPWFRILYDSGLVHTWWSNLDDIVAKKYTIDDKIHDFYQKA
eukprot:CAMPEP_0197081794 /NCGR_PEP_ID=MMETSP1384-20130603/214809_1 /TAXON_ID=29189 /ORGANISM="Ammonia sp." /LENGTH=272 /DNA_ID=CAMNT_0042520693 /DNA_START=888 /DNA_END=1706 /DNA_ORIENTATION=-